MQDDIQPTFPPLATVVSLLSDAVSHRAELASLELEEAREHALGSILLAALAAVLVLLAGFAFTFLVATLAWMSPHREWWLTGLTVLYLAGGTASLVVLTRRLRNWHPLDETVLQLKKDYHLCLSPKKSH